MYLLNIHPKSSADLCRARQEQLLRAIFCNSIKRSAQHIPVQLSSFNSLVEQRRQRHFGKIFTGAVQRLIRGRHQLYDHSFDCITVCQPGIVAVLWGQTAVNEWHHTCKIHRSGDHTMQGQVTDLRPAGFMGVCFGCSIGAQTIFSKCSVVGHGFLPRVVTYAALIYGKDGRRSNLPGEEPFLLFKKT